MKSLIKALSVFAILSACLCQFNSIPNTCMNPGKTPYRDNGKCIDKCPVNKVPDANLVCQCIDGYLSQNGICVLTCDPDYPVVEQGFCKKACPKDLFYDPYVAKCLCLDSSSVLSVDGLSCLQSCPTNYYAIPPFNQCTCLGTISSTTCTSCPVANIKYDSFNKRCTSSCPTGTIQHETIQNLCVQLTCNRFGQSLSGNTCNCDSSLLLIKNSGGRCECQANMVYDGISKCIPKCNDNQFILNGACVNSCGSGYYKDRFYCFQKTSDIINCGIGKVFDSNSLSCVCEPYKIQSIEDGNCYTFSDFSDTTLKLKHDCMKPGYFLSLDLGLDGNFKCTKCPDGYESNENSGYLICNKCSGTFACRFVNNKFVKEDCTSNGRIANPFNTKCTLCPDGQYIDDSSDPIKCSKVTGAFYSNRSTLSLKLPCPPGTQVISDLNVLINIGCVPCEPKKYNDGSKTTCDDCLTHTIVSNGRDACLTCGPGKTADTTQTSCKPCDAKFYSNELTNFECKACPTDYVSNATFDDCVKP